MSIKPALFQSAGQASEHLRPGVYSRINSVRNSLGFASATNGVIIGRGFGPEPFVLHEFTGTGEVLADIAGGDLREALRLSFDPSPQFQPQRLFAMVVNASTRATRTLNDVLVVTSRQYGAHTNRISIVVAAGTTEGRKITLRYRGLDEVFDNVVRPLLTLTGTTGEVTITNTASVGTLVSGAVTATLDEYATIQDLADYLSAQDDLTAEVEPGAENRSPRELDQVTSVAITSGAVFGGLATAIVDTLNGASALVTAATVPAEGIQPPNNMTDPVFLTGAVNGDYTSAQWNTALEALEAEDIQYVATPDSDPAVHAAIRTHCRTMSSVTNRKERQFVVGGGLTDSVSDATDGSKALNSFEGMLVHSGGGFEQRNALGIIQQFPDSYAACMVMAMKTAMAIAAPLTAKQLNVLRFVKKLRGSEITTLLRNGVCVLAYNDSNMPAIERQLNTYQTDDLKRNEFSMMSIQSFVSRDIRTYLHELFIGNAQYRTALGALEGAARNRLAGYVDLGLFTSDSQGRTFWNVKLRSEGDKIWLDYDANITAPINFVFVTQHFSEAI